MAEPLEIEDGIYQFDRWGGFFMRFLQKLLDFQRLSLATSKHVRISLAEEAKKDIRRVCY